MGKNLKTLAGNEERRKLEASRKIWLERLQAEEDLSLFTGKGERGHWNYMDAGGSEGPGKSGETGGTGTGLVRLVGTRTGRQYKLHATSSVNSGRVGKVPSSCSGELGSQLA